MMSKTPLHPTSNANQYWVRRAINQRWDNVFAMSGSISPFERWSDTNYAPRPLPVHHDETDTAYIITADLPGFESPDIHVDMRRDQLIILASHGFEASENECYCELSLPASINRTSGVVEFSEGLLTVSFEKAKPGVFSWMRAASGRLQKSLNPFAHPENEAIPG